MICDTVKESWKDFRVYIICCERNLEIFRDFQRFLGIILGSSEGFIRFCGSFWDFQDFSRFLGFLKFFLDFLRNCTRFLE